ncbi:MAG: hypothetical protein AAF548_16750 [Actinomycetota bacterium]
MSRDTPEPHAAETTVDRIAHAMTPAEWKRSSLIVVSVIFASVAAMTVVQRALIANDLTGWIITGIHAVVVLVAVPLLIRYAWREWAAAREAS